MGKYDDARFLEATIDKLKADLLALKMSTMPLASHQRGPTPGWLNAGQIGPGPGMKSSMHLHLDGNQPGIAPRQTVTDVNGVVRAEIGNLAAVGNSPAQYGFRAIDGSGNPLFDSLGLISVMNRLAKVDMSVGLSTFTTTSFVVITGVTSTFSLPRSERVIVLGFVIGATTTQTGEVVLFLDGVAQGNDIGGSAFSLLQWGINGPTVSSSTAFDQTLAAGSHTIDLRGRVTATPATFSVNYASMLIYQGGN